MTLKEQTSETTKVIIYMILGLPTDVPEEVISCKIPTAKNVECQTLYEIKDRVPTRTVIV